MPSIAPGGYLLDEFHGLCAQERDLLAHLYWPRNERFYEESRRAHALGHGWPLVATTGHGVSAPTRPTINFFVADERWVTSYAHAAESRGIRHGLLVRRAALEQLARSPGFELAEVRPGHPHGHGVVDPEHFWKFDIPNHRYAALHELRFATVARLATPDPPHARRLDVPREAVVLVW